MQSIWGDLFATRKNKLFSISLKTFVFVLICTSWIFRSSREPSFEFLALPLWCPRACAHSLRMCACVHSLCMCAQFAYVCMCACAHSLRTRLCREIPCYFSFSRGFLLSLVLCRCPIFLPLALSHAHTRTLSPLSLSLSHTLRSNYFRSSFQAHCVQPTYLFVLVQREQKFV